MREILQLGSLGKIGSPPLPLPPQTALNCQDKVETFLVEKICHAFHNAIAAKFGCRYNRSSSKGAVKYILQLRDILCLRGARKMIISDPSNDTERGKGQHFDVYRFCWGSFPPLSICSILDISPGKLCCVRIKESDNCHIVHQAPSSPMTSIVDTHNTLPLV